MRDLDGHSMGIRLAFMGPTRGTNLPALCIEAKIENFATNKKTAEAVVSNSAVHGERWWAMTGSNRRHSRCKRDALPTELIARAIITECFF
jgi:hypothetical protein